MAMVIIEKPISPCPKTGKPRKTFHLRHYHDETYDYLGAQPSRKLIEIRKRVAEGLVASGQPVSLETFKGKPTVTRMRLDEAADRYLERKATGWADSTLRKNQGYRVAICGPKGYWQPHIDPQKITSDDAEKWLALMKERKISASYQRLLKVFMAGTLDVAGVKPNPFRDRSLSKIRGRAKRKPLPTSAQLRKTREILAANPDRGDEAAWLMDGGEHSGGRPAEVREVTWEQIDNERDMIVGVGTKTDYERTVPRLSFQPDWIPKRPPGATGRITTMSEGTFYSRLAAASKEAGFQFSPNQLRHVHASRLLKWKGSLHDMDFPDMAHRMGHNVARFKDDYTHFIAPED